MPPKKQTGSRPPPNQLQATLAALESQSTDHDRQNLVKFAINPTKAFGVSMANLKVLAKQFGRDHELAKALWESGWYEARMLASLIDDPALVTPAQMDRWCREFDNWGICDTVCFALFDRTPHAWAKITQWSKRRAEFEKRAAFALLWGLTVHDKSDDDEPFVEGLALIECAADDERHFVKKAVNMALRAVGKRNRNLNIVAIEVATRLAASGDVTPRWIGKDALRELVGRFGR
jgi:3-methyladenine DNA glycosylase AlkD